MHSKIKGSLGEMKVASDLMQRGFYVFKELGDLAPFDLVASKNEELYKIQVKWVKADKNNTIVLDLRRCMSNHSGYYYEKLYSKKEVDIFALYISDIDKVIYVNWSDIGQNANSIRIRLSPSKNGQKKYCHLVAEFEKIGKL